nr:hypothetical protein [Tanacetum cinerariifolium]
NLIPIPSEYEVTSDDESEYDVPVKDDSSPAFTTFSNPLFDYNDDFTSSDDESLPDEDVLTEEFKEFSGELAHINPILPEIKEAGFDLEEEIHFVENLLYDNSSPRPPKELNAEIIDTIFEYLSPSPIPVENIDSLMNEIDLFLATDKLLPSSFESDNYDSEGEIYALKELLVDNSIPSSKNKLSDFHQDDPSFPRPPSEPPDDEFFEPEVISAVKNNIVELNEDECFNPGEEFKVYSNPLFDDEEINSDKLDPHCFNVEFDLIESLLNRDTLIKSSPKFDFLLKEFSGDLAHINPILPEIKEADFDLEEEIHFVENLLYDNSSPRPLKELNAEIIDTIFESLSPSPIPVEDSDSLMNEIDLFLATDKLLPSSFESEDYDSEGEIYALKELLVDNSIPSSKNKLSDFHQDDPSFPRPPPKPPDDEFFEPEVILAVKNNIVELNEDECFNP